MNFIDKAFESNLSGDDFLQAMADIYSEPEVREILDKYPQFVKDVFAEISVSWRKLFITLNEMKLIKFNMESLINIYTIFSLIYQKELKGFQELAVYYKIMEVIR